MNVPDSIKYFKPNKLFVVQNLQDIYFTIYISYNSIYFILVWTRFWIC